MKNEITINIIGPARTGKSSIGKLISELLNKYCIETTLNQIAGEPDVSTERAEEVVAILAQSGLTVTVNEVMAREPLTLTKQEK